MSGSRHWPLTLLGGLSSLFNLFLPLVLVRLLSAEEMGHYKLFFLYLAFAGWFSLCTGFTSSLGYWSGRPERDRAFGFSAMLVCGVCSLIVVFGALMPQAMWGRVGLSPDLTSAFPLALAAIIMAAYLEESLVVSGKIVPAALNLSGTELMRTAAMVTIALKGGGLEWIVRAHVAFTVLRAISAALICATRGIPLFARGVAGDEKLFRAVLAHALPLSMGAVASVLANYSDQLLLSRFLEPAAFAAYALACLTVPPLFSFEQSVNRVLIPELSQSLARGDAEGARRSLRHSVADLAWIFIPSVVGLMFFAEPLMRLLFTEKFVFAAPYMRAYALFYLALMIPFDAVARAMGRVKWIFWAYLGAGFASLGLGRALIPAFGPYGALGALLLVSFLLRGGGFWLGCRWLGWSPVESLPLRRLTGYLISAVLWCGLGRVALGFLGGSTAALLGCMAGVALAYFVTSQRVSGATHARPVVLHVTPYLSLGGLERFIVNLASDHSRAGVARVLVCVFDESEGSGPSLAPLLETAGVRVIRQPKGPGFRLRAAFRLAALARSEQVDLLHTHDIGALIYGSFAKLLSLGRFGIVHTQHGFSHRGIKARYRLYDRFFARFADKVCAVSEHVRQVYLEAGVPSDRLELVENGLPFPEHPVAEEERTEARRRLRGGSDLEKLWLVSLARIHPAKGQDRLLRIWSRLPKERRGEARLFLVGQESVSGETERLRTLAAELGLGSEVVFVGPSLEPDLWIRAADGIVSGSDYEGLPLAPLEGLGAGRWAFLSNIEGHAPLAPPARLFPRDNEAEAARLLAELIALGRAPSDWAAAAGLRERYGIAKMSRRYLELYRITASR